MPHMPIQNRTFGLFHAVLDIILSKNSTEFVTQATRPRVNTLSVNIWNPAKAQKKVVYFGLERYLPQKAIFINPSNAGVWDISVQVNCFSLSESACHKSLAESASTFNLCRHRCQHYLHTLHYL